MAVDFIKNRVGARHIETAKEQQEQLSYFTQSKVQKNITEEYVQQYAERNFRSNEKFLNWIKMLLRTENFLTYYKYFRYPVPSAKIVQDRIKPQLQRVFFAEDSHSKHVINKESVEDPDELDKKKFKELLFNALLFRHNDILIEDLKGINDPFRELISIENVVAIESKNSEIRRIAFTALYAELTEGNVITTSEGFVYMDDERYAFYDKDYVLLNESLHDLGKCPADYISKEPFSTECDIVRKSIFSYVKADMEEYCFLKTLQKMTEPNGAIPVVTMVKSKKKTTQDEDKGVVSDKEPMTAREIGSQHSDEWSKTTSASDSVLQTGTVVEIKPLKLEAGGLDMSAVTDYLNFHHHPVEAMKYLNDRIKEIELQIEMSIVGEIADQTGERKNEKQVGAGFVSAQDRLRQLSMQLSRIHTISDWKFLALKYGPNNVIAEVFYGSDFFLESQKDLYDLFEKSPNPIERKNILIRLTKNQNKFNPEKAQRERILYDLMPFVSDDDFTMALEQMIVDWPTKQLQTRFNYWISVFESQFGDIVVFWDSLESTAAEKLIVINNILRSIINQVAPEQTQVQDQPQNQKNVETT